LTGGGPGGGKAEEQTCFLQDEAAGGRTQPQKKKRRRRKKKSDVFSMLEPSVPSHLSTWVDVKEAIRDKAKELKLGPTRFAACEKPRPDRMAAYQKWIDSGMHGEMAYLAREDRLERRRDPRIVLDGAKSIIVSSMFYWPGKGGFPWPKVSERERLGADSEGRGLVSCYAWGDDYHQIMGSKLRDLATFAVELCGGNSRWYVDTGAVMERDLAERAGLGFTGKNTLSIHSNYGSGFFIGSVFTTLPLPPDEPMKKPSYCGSCTKCQVACPTGALAPTRDFVMDARRCISYLTIELKGSIPVELRPLVGTWIYGCDICQVRLRKVGPSHHFLFVSLISDSLLVVCFLPQEVCPWNQFSWQGQSSPSWGQVSKDISFPVLRDLLHMDETEFEARFAQSAVKRIGRDRFLRNVCVALGNSGDVRAIPPLRKAMETESDLVKEHASWAITRIAEQQRSSSKTTTTT